VPPSKKKPKRGRRNDSFDQIFLRLARKHLSEHFPNPERRGCPLEGKLRVLGADPRQVEAWVVDHLSFCPRCYRAYSRILQELKSKKPVKLHVVRAPAAREEK
jgi:hypothetical protein